MEVLPRVVIPLEKTERPRDQVDTRPAVAGGVVIRREEYIAMGATPGCSGCRAIARGGSGHQPHSHERRARAIIWLKGQSDHRIQERLAMPR